MTCDCNCHYGYNEELCKNCNCKTKTFCKCCNQALPKESINIVKNIKKDHD